MHRHEAGRFRPKSAAHQPHARRALQAAARLRQAEGRSEDHPVSGERSGACAREAGRVPRRKRIQAALVRRARHTDAVRREVAARVSSELAHVSVWRQLRRKLHRLVHRRGPQGLRDRRSGGPNRSRQLSGRQKGHCSFTCAITNQLVDTRFIR